jgi:methenyltetrahydromethanopterin cyclohydrolase
MSASRIGLNDSSLSLIKKLAKEADRYSLMVEKSESGATLIDAGLNAEGGFFAGVIVTEICLGGYGKAKIMPMQYEDLTLPSIFVYTDHPVLSTMVSQFAGWKINTDKFSATASGPARALALEPKDLFERIEYAEKSNVAVLVLETESKPPEDSIQEIAIKCKVAPANLFIIYFSSESLMGVMQISAKTIEAGLFRLMSLGLNPWMVSHAWGCAPIGPVPPIPEQRNDVVSYGGTASYTLSYENDEQLRKWATMASASSAKMVEEAMKLSAKNPLYAQILEENILNLKTIDGSTFAPAVIVISNSKTGKNLRAGKLDIEALKTSLDYK